MNKRQLIIIALCILLSYIVNTEEKIIDCHRKMSKEEFISLDVAEKIDIFICRFNYHKGLELEMDRWHNIIMNDLEMNKFNTRDVHLVLKKHVEDSIIGYTEEIYNKIKKLNNVLADKDSRKFDYGLQLAWDYIFFLIKNNNLKKSEIKWFINKFQDKLIQYIKMVRYINRTVEKYEYMIEKMKNIKYEDKNSITQTGKKLYVKYSELGFKDLRIEKSMMFPEYEELKKKYNSSSTTGAISGAGGSIK